MDILSFTDLIPWLATHLGITPSSLVFYIGLVVMLSKLAARLIPDDSTGWLGIAHKIAKFIAVDVSNRITAGVSQVDLAKAALESTVRQEVEEVIPRVAEQILPEPIEDLGTEALRRAFESQFDERK